MGVPGFFMWLWKNYKKTHFVFSKSELDVKSDKALLDQVNKLDYLLIDANCLIHPVCFKVLADNPTLTNMDKLESKMRTASIEYIEKLINHVRPKRGVYLAIDGVAPVAKIKQQRSRRFKSVSDRDLWNNIRKKHEKENPFFWNNSAITPGTEFMIKLHDKIQQWAEEYTKKNKIEIIYSSCYTPTEGEHKLLQFIRNNMKEKKDYTYITYGLDADLIFLILSTGINNTFLLREAYQFDKKANSDALNFVSISIMRTAIIERIHKLIEKNLDLEEETIISFFKTTLDDTHLINDFIFICCLMGNDFLPHLPALDIYEGAIDYLLEKYTNILIENYINGNQDSNSNYMIEANKKEKINQVFFNQFIEQLSSEEEQILINNFGKKVRKFRCQSSDPYDIEMHKIDNLNFKIDDPVKLGSDNMVSSKERYYKHYFHVEPAEIDEFSNRMSKHYLTGLKWVTEYYFDKCPSWNWYYPYEHPPFLQDINKHITPFKKIKFNIGEPLKPHQQLLTVLPKQSAYLLPKSLRKIMLNLNSSMSHLYPLHFQQDFINKKKYWMAIPILPPLEIDIVKKTFKKYESKLASGERMMNEIKDIYIYN